MLAINRKLLRDVWQLKTQFVAIGLVIGCGVAMIVLAWSMLASLQLTQERYYEQTIVLAELALRLARDWDLVDFSPRICTDWVLQQLGAIRRSYRRLRFFADIFCVHTV